MRIPTDRYVVPNSLPDICRAIAWFEIDGMPKEIVPPAPEILYIYVALLYIGRGNKRVMYDGVDISKSLITNTDPTPLTFFDKFDHTAACLWAGYDTKILRSMLIHPSPIKLAVLAHNLVYMWDMYNKSTFSFNNRFFTDHASDIIDSIQTHFLAAVPHYYHAINNLVTGLRVHRFISIDTATYSPSAQMMIDHNGVDPNKCWHMRAHQAWLNRAPCTPFACRNRYLATHLLGMQRLVDTGVIASPHLSMLEDMLNNWMRYVDFPCICNQ